MGLRLDRLWLASSINRRVYEIILTDSPARIGKVFGNGSIGEGDGGPATATFNENQLYMSVWACSGPGYECYYDEEYAEPCDDMHISDGIGKCRPCSQFRIVKCRMTCPEGLLRVNNLCLQVSTGAPTFVFSVRVPRPEVLAKYERSIARAMGIDADQVIASLDSVTLPAQAPARRLLQAKMQQGARSAAAQQGARSAAR